MIFVVAIFVYFFSSRRGLNPSTIGKANTIYHRSSYVMQLQRAETARDLSSVILLQLKTIVVVF